MTTPSRAQTRHSRTVVVLLVGALVLALGVPVFAAGPARAAQATRAAQAAGVPPGSSACIVSLDDNGGGERCSDPGEAHLSSAAAGRVAMTSVQYAALQRIEDQANAAVRAVHGMSSSPESHDRVVRYATAELRAALLGRILLIMQKQDGTRSTDEQAVAEWVAKLEQAHAKEVARQAQFEFFRWARAQDGDAETGPCHYKAPPPYSDEWPGSQGYDDRCGGSGSGGPILNPIPIYDDSTRQPSLEQFIRWGAAEADRSRLSDPDLVGTAGLTGISALALAAGDATTDPNGPAAATTRVLAASGVRSAFTPLAAAGSDVPNTDLATMPGASQRIGSWTGQLPGSVVSTEVDAMLRSSGRGMFAGYDQPGGKVDEQLQGYLDATNNYAPSLNRMGGSIDAVRVVYSDLVEALPDTCSSPGVIDFSGGLCPGQGSPAFPRRTAADPLLTDLKGGVVKERGTGVTFYTASVGASYAPRSGAFTQERKLTLADGWFTVDGIATPLLELSYARESETNQVVETRYEIADGQPVFRTLPRTSRLYGRDLTYGTCTSDGSTRCRTSGSVPFKDPILTTSGQRYDALGLVADAPPSLPTLQPSTQTVEVGQLVTLSASPASDPEGDQVVSESWTAEFDYPCPQSVPAAVDWECGIGPRGGNGPHGGYVFPTGTKVVWNTPGTWQIALTRTDEYGASSTKTQTVQVVAPSRNGFGVGCDADCVTSSGEAVLRGFVQAGPTRDRESVTIDWGDGTVTTDVPSSIFVRGEVADSNTAPRTLASGTVVTPVSSVAQDFVSRHRYAAPRSGGYPIRVVFDDAGQGGRTVTFTATAPPVTVPSVTSITPGAATEGSPTTLRAVIADDSAGDAGTATIAWGDGTSTTGVPYASPASGGGLSATHTYVDDGRYAVTVTPTDAGGATGNRGIATQVVAAVAPTVVGLGVTPVTEGATATLTGRITDPGAGDSGIVSIDWGDGSAPTYQFYAAPGGPGNGAFSAGHAYAAHGTYTVTVSAGDDDLTGDPTTTPAVVGNAAPRVASTSLYPADEGGTDNIVARVTDAGVGDAGTVVVDFGDGSPTQTVPYDAPGTSGATVSVEHVYADDGEYAVRLTPTDEDGATGPTTTATQVVTGVAPVASDTSVTGAAEGSTSTLTTTVTDAGALDAGTLSIDWGDGSPRASVQYAAGGGRVTATHVYLDDKGGPFRVTVTPADEDGLSGAPASASADVTNAKPTVQGQLRDAFGDVSSLGAFSRSIVVGVPMTLTSDFADPGRGDARTARVDWGDGTSAAGTAQELANATHTWQKSGAFRVVVTVTDDGGASSTFSLLVPVQKTLKQTSTVARAVRVAAHVKGTPTATVEALRRAVIRLTGSSSKDPDSAVAALRGNRLAAAADALAAADDELATAQSSGAYEDVAADQRAIALILRSVAQSVVAQAGTAAGQQALSDGNDAVARGDVSAAVQYYLEATRG